MRGGRGAKGGTEKVRSFVTFFTEGFPYFCFCLRQYFAVFSSPLGLGVQYRYIYAPTLICPSVVGFNAHPLKPLIPKPFFWLRSQEINHLRWLYKVFKMKNYVSIIKKIM